MKRISRTLPKQWMAWFLCMCMFFSSTTLAYAVENQADDGLCVHHPAHNAECGYMPGTAGQNCTHIHDDSCGYTEGIQGQDCTHQHDAACEYQEAVEEVPCSMECVDADGDGTIDHLAECLYQPATQGHACMHVHDDACGYVAAVEEGGCTHVHDDSCGFVQAQDGVACSYASEGCPNCVVSWSWVDEAQILSEIDGAWGLGLPGASQENPLTRDALKEFLPGQITATMGSGETLALEVIWDLTPVPEKGAYTGEYRLKAALADAAYALTEKVATLEVTLQLGETQDYALSLPSGTPPFSENVVGGVSPSGTTINLFDYWLTSQTDSDINNPEWLIDKGINNGHALIFRSGDRENQGDWNKWTGTENPRTGIVSNTLENGYPKLNVDISQASSLNGRDGQESLAYLFDPNWAHEGKKSYKDVQGLLQVNSEGYYFFNSTENYAVYYADANSFTLYKYPGVLPGGSSPLGQFFPFNEATANAVPVWYTPSGEQQKQYTVMNASKSNDASINHYFGIHMSTRFIQQYKGYTDANQKTPVTYEFAGDDDVWIFIDGVLVADLGGIHDAASVKIDFSKGEIFINNQRQEQTLGQLLGFPSSTLPDNTYHTLDFFYLERGNVDSNMYLKYNLVTIPESSLIKVDQVGDPVPETEFQLYAANDTDLSDPIATGTTDHNGEFVFVDAKGFPITIQGLYDQYKDSTDGKGNNLILKETETPAGYRSGGEIGLYFYETEADEVLLLSNSVWDEGVYAMPKVTTVAPNQIKLLDEQGTTIPLTGNDAVENPVMFAVVFQKQDENTWYPVSGDPLNGWKVYPDSSWNSVLSAAQKNRYVFQLASSGAYQVEVSNLPGDIKTYYHVCKDRSKAQYTVAYYYTTANALSGATEDNTTRIDSDEETGSHVMNRVFSANLYVTNIKNRFFVQKVDQAGNPINGAEFSLYKSEDVTVANGTVTVNQGATPYDRVITSDLSDIIKMNGGGVFPTPGKVLEFGEYYLIETSPPAGYQGNANAIHVIADKTGVYADAGVLDDGISVLRGAGSVMRSMVQFASDDKVDTTLREIKATLASSVTFNGYNKDGSFTVGEGSWDVMDNVLHLQFANAHQVLDYGLYDGTEGTIDNLTKRTETGWSKLLIRQCFAHNGDVNADLKEDLGDQDITNLFSGTVTVRVSNHKMGGLTISKTVTGDLGNRDTEFQFTVKLMNADGLPLSGSYRYTGGVLADVSGVSAPADGTLTLDANGRATFTLKHGQYIAIQDLLTGYRYEVWETGAQEMGYVTQYAIDGGEKKTGSHVSGTLPETGAALVSFENSRNYVPPTGINTDIRPWLLIMGIALAGGTVLFLNGRLLSNGR